MSTPSVPIFGTQVCSNTAALLLIPGLDQGDRQEGNYRDIEEFLHELDLERSHEHARTFGER